MRHVAKAAAGIVPLAGSALAEIADAAVPDLEARERDRWEGDVTRGINELHGRADDLDRRTGLVEVRFSGAVAGIAAYLIKRCPDGLARDHVDRDNLIGSLPDYSPEELLDGLGELESYGLVSCDEFANNEAIYCLTDYAYEVLDPPIMGWDVIADARLVATAAMRNRDYVLTYDLEQLLGWPRRRFNVAHRIIVRMIDPAHVCDELQASYVTSQFNPSNGEWARLRRFAAGE
ncbi:MAG TPA: hypothetical protein VMG08_16265 [Allosphingosinicella sp.]|nr:hypothetical protein [Allosphingosinicella sp.]